MAMLLLTVTYNYDFFLLYYLHIISAIVFHMETENKIWKKMKKKWKKK